LWLASLAAQLRPRVVLLGNLFRDQLDRYGELETIAESWERVIEDGPEQAGSDGQRRRGTPGRGPRGALHAEHARRAGRGITRPARPLQRLQRARSRRARNRPRGSARDDR